MTKGASMRIGISCSVALLVCGLAVGCSGGDAPDAKLTVKMSEWLFEPSATSIKSGNVKFTVNNVGGAEHELVIVKGTDPKALATKTDGSVDEEKILEALKVGEVEKVAARTTKSGTLEVEPGTYVLMCNLVDANGASHFAKGMVATLTVK